MSSMTSFSERVTRIEEEITRVRALCDYSKGFKNDSEVTTTEGRTYRVANVCLREKEWIPTDFLSEGMFRCEHCQKAIGGSNWTLFTHGDANVRLHDSTFHMLKMHPEHISVTSEISLAKVFLE